MPLSTSLRLLHVEADPAVTARIMLALQRAALRVEGRGVSSEAALRAALHPPPDILLLPLPLPSIDLPVLVAECRALPRPLPVLLIGEADSPAEQVAALMRAGACDFLPLSHLDRLADAIREALAWADEEAEHHVRARKLAEESQRYQHLIHQGNMGVWRFDMAEPVPVTLPSGEQIACYYRHAAIGEHNAALARMYGYSPDGSLLGASLDHFLPQDDPESHTLLEAFISGGHQLMDQESHEQDAAGNDRYFLNSMIGVVEEGALRSVWGIQHDISDRRQRERELQAIASIATALRGAATRAEIIWILQAHARALVQAGGVAVAVYSPESEQLHIEATSGTWSAWQGLTLHVSGGARHPLLQPYPARWQIDREDALWSRLPTPPHPMHTVITVAPLIREGHRELLWVGAEQPLGEGALALLVAISDIAANALHRAALNEQTEQRLQRLASLHYLDLTITASMDLGVTLDVFLEQVVAQLGVDAAVLLLYNPHALLLEEAASRGLRRRAPERAAIHLSDPLVGRAAREQQLVHLPEIQAELPQGARAALLAAEQVIGYLAKPLLAQGEVQGVLELFRRSPLKVDNEWLSFLDMLAGQAALAINNATLFERLQRSNLELSLAYDATIRSWAGSVPDVSVGGGAPLQQLVQRAEDLARYMQLPERDLVHLRRGALLHDIGMQHVPHAILYKHGPLTEEEWEIVREHPRHARRLLAPITYLHPALPIPCYHHERWDGSGYPNGLRGTEIPLHARLFAVVDVWEALCAPRPHRPPWSPVAARAHLEQEAGRLYDAEMVTAFFAMLDEEEQGA